MCEEPATTREHAPAKMFFPEEKDLPGSDLRKKLITVPSCAAHNTATAKDDEYVVAVVAAHHANVQLAVDHFATKVLRALKRSEGYKAAVARDSVAVEHEGVRTLALRVDDARFTSVMEKVARAIFFHHTNRKWPGSTTVISPSFVQESAGTTALHRLPGFDELEAGAAQLFAASPEYGSNPDVFCYQLIEHENHILIKLTFYRGFMVFGTNRGGEGFELTAG